MNRKQNAATDAAALIIPAVGNNKLRHETLQHFMLANDSATVAIEIPIWLDEDDIAALEQQHGIQLTPHVGSADRTITGHIDFLQVRNGAVYILDYKPDAQKNKPIARDLRARPDAASTRSQTFRYQMRMVQRTRVLRDFPARCSERRHERSFGGPPVNEQYRGAIPCRFRREHVGLEFAFRRSDTRRYGVAEMKSRPLDQQVVVGAPVSRNARRAEPLESVLAPHLVGIT